MTSASLVLKPFQKKNCIALLPQFCFTQICLAVGRAGSHAE